MKRGVIVQVHTLKNLGEQGERQRAWQLGLWPYKGHGRAWILWQQTGDSIPSTVWVKALVLRSPSWIARWLLLGLWRKVSNGPKET